MSVLTLLSFPFSPPFACALSETANVGGVHVYIRTSSFANDPVLMLSGGPCMPLAASMPRLLEDLSESYTLIYFDMRGVGRATGSFTSRWQDHVDDSILVARYALSRLKRQTLTVWGHSAGTLLALNMSAQAPELVNKVIATSLKVDQQKTGDSRDDIIQSVWGIPASITSLLPSFLQRALLFSGPDRLACVRNPASWDCLRVRSPVDVQGLMDEYGIIGSIVVPLQAEYAKSYLGDDWNLVRIGTVTLPLQSPLYVIHGSEDYVDSHLLVADAVDRLQAPSKEVIWMESGHFPMLDKPDAYMDTLLRVLGKK